MNQPKISKKIFIFLIFISLLFQLSACGWILHPERRGQNGGRIDAGIAVLDGVGLVFFLIPGIIAYAVDFSTGCIYLPGGAFSAVPGDDEISVVKIDPSELSEKTIKIIVARETGLSDTIDLNKAVVCTLDGIEDVPARLAELKNNGYQIQSSLAVR